MSVVKNSTIKKTNRIKKVHDHISSWNYTSHEEFMTRLPKITLKEAIAEYRETYEYEDEDVADNTREAMLEAVESLSSLFQACFLQAAEEADEELADNEEI